MEFLVEFEVNVPRGAPASEVEAREGAEAAAAATLVEDGHLARLWRRRATSGPTKALGLYCAGSEAELTQLLRALPLYDWMNVSVTPLAAHPNDPGPTAAVPVVAASQK